jgi:hypothetical protein
MKVIQKGSTSISSLKTMIGRIKSGSFAAYQIDKKADVTKVAKEIEAFIGKDLKPLTVLMIKEG